MKLYVASSWRNVHQPAVVAELRKAGHEVYDFHNPAPGNKGFHWSETDPEWKAWTPSAFRAGLASHTAAFGFEADWEGMRWAEMVVLVLPSGRSAHMEAGWMLGNGKPAIIYCPEPVEPELMYLLAGECPKDWLAVSMEELIAQLDFARRRIEAEAKDERVLYGKAVGLAVINDGASISLLQRRLNFGYTRAALLLDRLVRAGILGDFKSDGTCVRRCLLNVPGAFDTEKVEEIGT
jgi:DNA segregation ATPase FtsK/SpoIIIE-like protein